MDPILNPYAPGSGLPPPELAGRDELRETVRIAIERVKRGRPGKSVLIVGLAGVGKTALLDRMRGDAVAAGNQAVRVTASGARSLPALLAPELRLALLRLARQANAQDSAHRGLRALASFAQVMKHQYPDLEVGRDFEAERGLADRGELREDLTALCECVGAAARSADTAVALCIDDLHFIPVAELSALVTAFHACAEQALPIALLGTGLPPLRGHLSGAIRSRTDRLSNFTEIGALSAVAAEQAVRKPAADLGVEYEDGAIAHILAITQCHPYFLQELARHAWDSAAQAPISLRDARNAALYALASLDENFFRPRLERLSPAERKYLRAMAELGAGPLRSGEVAAALNRPVTSLGPTRAQLMAKGLIWSPGHGETAYTVPRVDEYLRRTWLDESWRN